MGEVMRARWCLLGLLIAGLIAGCRGRTAAEAEAEAETEAGAETEAETEEETEEETAAERGCTDRPGQLVRCQRTFTLPVHPWTDRALPRDDREGGPKAVLVDAAAGELWVAMLVGPPALRIHDLATGQQKAAIELGELGAVEFAVSKDGDRVYVSQLESSTIFEIDRSARTVLREFPAGGDWPKILELSADGSALFSSNWTGGTVTRIDLTSGLVADSYEVGEVPRGLYATADGRSLFVAGFGDGDLRRIELETGKVEVIHDSTGALRHIVADEERGVLYVSDLRHAKILRVDLETLAVTEWASTRPKPNTIHLSPDGRVLFVSCRGPNNPESYLDPGPEWGAVLLLDTATGELLDAIVGGNQPTGLDLSADGSLLVFSDFIDNRLNLYDVPGSAELAAGGGGRASSYREDLIKPDWGGWIPASP